MKKALTSFLIISLLSSCNTINSQGDFPNYIDVKNLRIFAREDVSLSFLNNVGEAYREMFSDNSNIDSIIRSNYLTISGEENVYQRVGVDGMANNSNFSAGRAPKPFDENATDYIWELNSGGEDQIGEVIEHLLHTVTTVSLHLAYPNNWNYNDANSELRIAMQEAIDKGVYDISSYDDLKNDHDIYHKILTQEYAYWLILAEWDYFEITGKKINGISGNEEFIIGTPSEITNQLPLGHKLYEDYIEKILSIPNVQKVVSLFS